MTRPVPFEPATWPPCVRDMPVCPKRGLPVPFINEITPDGVGVFTILDDRKADLCLRGRLCAACSRPMGDEVALIGDVVSLRPDVGYFIEPPVHEECGLAALGGMCPFLAGEQVPRRDHTGDPTVAVVGMTAADLTDIGRGIAKRPVVMAITRTYTVAMTPSQGGSPVLVYQAGPLERVRRFAYGPDGRLTEVTEPEPPARAVRVVRTQRRTTTKRSRS
jgi:hypothetical protein